MDLHQSTRCWSFVRGIHRWPVNSPHKGLVSRKKLPFDDVIMQKSRMMHDADAWYVIPFLVVLQAPYNKVSYGIVGTEGAMQCFAVNEVTGVVVLKQSLLLEPCTAAQYSVSINSNTLRPRQNGRNFPDDIFKRVFLYSIKISLKS